MEYTKDDYYRTALEVIEAYNVLKVYDDRLCTKRLDEMMDDYKELAWTLERANNENSREEITKDVALVERMLNTKSCDYYEDKRKKLLKLVLQMAKDGKIADINTLMIPSQYDQIARQVADFYATYNQYDWQCSQDGWYDRAGEPTEAFELDIKKQDEKIDDLFGDMHWVLDGEGWNKQQREEAEEIVDGLRNFSIDPCPDRLQVVVCEPGRDAKLEFVDNGADCLKEYKGRKLTNRNVGSDIWCYYDANGLRDGKPRGRCLYDPNGKIIGSVKGVAIFTARDYHKNFVTLSDNQMSLVMSGYGKPDFNLEEKPADYEEQKEPESLFDDKKSKELLEKLLENMTYSPNGIETLKAIGMTAGEINQIRYAQERKKQRLEKMKKAKQSSEVAKKKQVIDDGEMKMK